MAKFTIIAARGLQILGHEGTVEGGTELATIETDCDIAALISAIHFGTARVDVPAEPDVEPSGDKPARSPARKTRSAAPPPAAPAGDATKGNVPTRRRK